MKLWTVHERVRCAQSNVVVLAINYEAWALPDKKLPTMKQRVVFEEREGHMHLGCWTLGFNHGAGEPNA